MPVWVKIGKLNSKTFIIEDMSISRKSSYIHVHDIPYKGADKSFSSFYITTDFNVKLIKVVWLTIVEFLEWYNKKD